VPARSDREAGNAKNGTLLIGDCVTSDNELQVPSVALSRNQEAFRLVPQT